MKKQTRQNEGIIGLTTSWSLPSSICLLVVKMCMCYTILFMWSAQHGDSQQTHYAIMTSLLVKTTIFCCNYVKMTSFWRYKDVIASSRIRWVAMLARGGNTRAPFVKLFECLPYLIGAFVDELRWQWRFYYVTCPLCIGGEGGGIWLHTW